jgi:hypothetical protein
MFLLYPCENTEYVINFDVAHCNSHVAVPVLIRSFRCKASTTFQHLCSSFASSFFCCLHKALCFDHFTFPNSEHSKLLQNGLCQKEERASPGYFSNNITLTFFRNLYSVSHASSIVFNTTLNYCTGYCTLCHT